MGGLVSSGGRGHGPPRPASPPPIPAPPPRARPRPPPAPLLPPPPPRSAGAGEPPRAARCRSRGAHGRASGGWGGGRWLPECAYAPWLDESLEAAGVHAFCVDLTDLHGLGAAEHLWPVRTPGGPVAVPIDRQTVELVWHEQAGYPA